MTMPLYIQYDSEQLQDGYGAQALRILGLYSLAKAFRLRYIHSPIKKLDFQGDKSLTPDMRLELTNKLNNLINFNAHNYPIGKVVQINIRNLGFRRLLSARWRSFITGESIVLKVLLPFGITDRLPFLYRIGAKEFYKLNKMLISKWDSHDVVVHIRTGNQPLDNLLISDKRFLPLSYFVNESNKIYRKIKTARRNCRFVIHTDLDANIAKNIELAKQIESSFAFLPADTEVRFGGNLFNVILDMVTARNLIMSNSALSYFAGILNQNSVIWYRNHGHSKLPGWETSS